jgi:plastocyanin
MLAGCGGSDKSTPSGAATATIRISETEYKLSPASLHVDGPGTVTVHVVNDGNVTHALEVEGEGVEEETEHISPGSSADLKVDIAKSGSYEVYCPIDDHRRRGMEATLTVGSASGSSETTTTSGGDGY